MVAVRKSQTAKIRNQVKATLRYVSRTNEERRQRQIAQIKVQSGLGEYWYSMLL